MSSHGYLPPERRRAYFDDMAGQGRIVDVDPQRHRTETFVKARELRKFIAEHPGCTSLEMPAEIRSYLTFLCRKRMVKWKGGWRSRHYWIQEMDVPDERRRDRGCC